MNKKRIKLFFILFALILIFYTQYQYFYKSFYKIQRKIITDINLNLDKSQNFLLLKNKNSKIYYTEHDEEFIYITQIIIDTYYPIISQDLNLTDMEKVIIIIYPDKESLKKNIDTNTKTTPMGVYYNGIIHILSPHCWTSSNIEAKEKDIFVKKGPIIHELTHYIIDLKTNGNYPIWFTEGVALYYENKYIGEEWHEEVKEEANKIKFSQLNNNFRKIDEVLAYRRSFDLINNIVNKYGESKLQYICDKLSKGKKINDIINFHDY